MSVFAAVARRSFVVSTMLLLAACGGGGGGGGGGGSSGTLSLSTSVLTFNAPTRSTTPPAQVVSATVTGVSSGTLYIKIVSTGPAVASISNVSITGPTTGQATVFPASANSLGPGSYSSTITVTACTTDPNCSSGQLIGTPQTINVTYTVPGNFATSPGSLYFNYINGGPLPPAQSISVLGDTGTSWTASANQSWVTLSSNTGTTPSTVNVTVNPAGLQPGTHTGSITFTAAGGLTSTVGVSLTISLPAITVSTATASFSYVRGGATPSPQSVALSGTSGLYWTASATQGWVNLSSSSGTTPSTISVGVNPGGLPAGIHTATVTFSAGALTASMVVSLTVSDPQLNISQTNLTFSGVNGAPFTPQTLNIALTNGATETWSATSSAGWLVLGQSSGTTPGTMTVNVNPAIGLLASGSYTATINFTATTAGLPVTRTVNVSLNLARATLSASPSQVTLGGTDGRNFSAQPVQLTLNTGANAHFWLTTPSAGWVQVSPSGSTVGSTPVTVSFALNPSGVLGGTYTGTVTFSANVNGDVVTRAVPVTLNLAAHKLLVADNGVAFVSAWNISKLSHAVRVVDNFGSSTPWTATSNQAWLSVTPNGTSGGQLTLTANPAGLTPETVHYATVTISSSDTSVEGTETVRVGLWVTSSDVTSTLTAAPGPFYEVASDPVRPYAYVHSSGTGISVYNVYSGALVGTIPGVAARLGSMAVSNDGQRLWAIDLNNYQIVPVDLTNWSVASPWALGGSVITEPRAAYARTNGKAVVIATDGRIYDANTGSPLVTYMTPYTNINFLVTASLNGNVFCVGSCRTLDYTDLNGGSVLVGPLLPSSGGDRDIAINADGTRVYGANGWPYECPGRDVTTGQIVQTLPVGPYPGNVEVGPDGKIFCGRNTAVFAGDYAVYAYNSSGVEVGRYLQGLAGLQDSQLVISGDAVRMITLSSGLRLTTVGP